jgi:hypothetical protein
MFPTGFYQRLQGGHAQLRSETWSDGDARGDLATRNRKIAAEAEVVVTRIYGQGMTVREQQERMESDDPIRSGDDGD